MFSKAAQAEVFLATIYAGLAAGAAYDMLRLLRVFLHAGRLLTALFDVVFWMLTAGMVALAVALSGEEGLRFYLLIGTVCGMLLWAGGLRRIMLWLEVLFLRLIARFQEGKKERGVELPEKRGDDQRHVQRVHAP